ncbi:DNA translocase FtsK [Candidatus Gottesmanbacteria bacterium]|nr:DNA translocase FtsK [Candidatus Gottesmanbacteria bacterium]
MAIWVWFFAIAIVLSFSWDTPQLAVFRDELYLHIGWGMYTLPPFLVLLSFLFLKLKAEIGKAHVPFGYFLTFFPLIVLTQAGIVGELVWKETVTRISSEGAMLFYLFMMVVGLLILFNASLDRVVNFVLLGVGAIGEWLVSLFTKPLISKQPSFMGNSGHMKIKGEDGELEKLSVSNPIVKVPIVPSTNSKTAILPTKTDVKQSSLSIHTPFSEPMQDMSLWEYPPLTLLSDGPGQKADRGDVRKNASVIEKTLESFGITARVSEVNTGPAVTQYAIEIALGTKVSKITSLASDLALALSAPTGQVRIEAPIPGRNLVGIEIPNRGLEFVTLKRMLQSEMMQKSKNKLAVALGLDVSGNPVIANIAKMPHILVAGTTGSGKSVLINAFITSLLFRARPDEVRLIMVDPKRVELTSYDGIPHLLTPVIVEPNKILSALRWATTEMDRRYKQFQEVKVRNIDAFNELSGFQAMPYIVILIDELADLMAYAPVEVEDAICRIAQMARATGIHLVLATQRPSVDVITGLIKANVPSRIAFNVSSMIDSRVIIDMPGAERLLGRGDMLFIPPDQSKPSRIQGTYVSDAEVGKVVDFLKNKNTPVEYTEEVLTQPLQSGKKASLLGGVGGGNDDLFIEAMRLICQHDKASASLLQRRLSVGYARAARIIDQLEAAGIIGPGDGAKPRDVLVKNPDEWLATHPNGNEPSEE